VDKYLSADPSSIAEETGFAELWASLLPLGRTTGGSGYRRFAWDGGDLACRDWFTAQAADRGLATETDRNGNQWAWWEPAAGQRVAGQRADAVAIGSHLDSVPDGGAFDGPLGVISSFAAVDLLRSRGWRPARPVCIANFADEEGARFGIACAGSRLMTGLLDPARARDLRDQDGISLATALERAGRDPEALGRDDDRLGLIGVFVELHIEQGRSLVDQGEPIGVATSIWPHGRWRFDFSGEANHAGTTRLDDRCDPMLTYAHTVLAARKKARLGGALATFGKIAVEPNGTNAIPSSVRAWLDSRAPDESTLAEVVDEIITTARDRAKRDGTGVEVVNESLTPLVEFDHVLRDRLAGVLGGVPALPTGAGHDAGILAAELPTAMLFVRNPTGRSHTPAEHAETRDCLIGVEALARTVQDLAGLESGT
jgi:beta-ureidopropionase / N-carbamoyl-L-amino-acid hydrolase